MGPEELTPGCPPIPVLNPADRYLRGSRFREDLLNPMEEGLDPGADPFDLFMKRKVGLDLMVLEVRGDNPLAPKIKKKGAEGLVGNGVDVDTDLDPARA